MLIDMRAGRGISATERKLFADFMKRCVAAIKTNLLRAAVISDSMLHRGGMTALTWIVPMPIELKFFSEPSAAERWLREALR